MSRYSKNVINNNYNIDKLNFTKIKKELETIPKIIKNHNKIGLKPCSSMSDIYKNNLNEKKYFEQNQNKNNFTPKTLSYKKSSSFKNIQNINIKNDINSSFNDDIIIQIKKENNQEINKIINLYELKIKEISLFYETKFCDLNQLLSDNLNEYKLLSSDYISLAQHKSIIIDLKKNYNDLLNKTKENYEKLIKKLTDIMKYKTKYQDLIKRLQVYTIYEVDINEIEKKFVNNLNEKLNNKLNEQNKGYHSYFNDFYLINQLDEDINYHQKMFELKQLYQEKLTELKFNNNNQFNNLINQVKYIFDNYSNFSSDDFLNTEKKDNMNDINLKNNINNYKDKYKNEIINLSGYKENECKSISNSEISSKNYNQNSSNEIDNLLNIISSNENIHKPETMEINNKLSSLK